MEISNTLYVANGKDWRKWLSKNFDSQKDIWLIYFKKHSGKPRIPYNDALDEALCFGWIDSIVKKLDENRFAQRFSPRRKNSTVSEINQERIRRMIKKKKMTKTGLIAVKGLMKLKPEQLKVNDDIKKALKDANAWKNFEKFSKAYKRIRIAFVENARTRPELFQKRLNYFIKMTAKNKKFGMFK